MKQKTRFSVADGGIEAEFHPGFSDDLTTWRLTIDSNGKLTQNVKLWQYTARRKIVTGQMALETEIEAATLVEIWKVAQKMEFEALPRQMQASMTDLDSRILRFFRDETATEIQAYGAGILAHGGSEKARRFLTIWDAVTSCAPFPHQFKPLS